MNVRSVFQAPSDLTSISPSCLLTRHPQSRTRNYVAQIGVVRKGYFIYHNPQVIGCVKMGHNTPEYLRLLEQCEFMGDKDRRHSISLRPPLLMGSVFAGRLGTPRLTTLPSAEDDNTYVRWCLL
jgi:hypothetical protein